MPKKDELATQTNQELSASEKFTNYVVKEYTSTVGSADITDGQKRLIQGYFVAIDKAIVSAEENRIAKNAKATDKKYTNEIAVSWNTVDLQQLALDVKYFSKIGLDMMQTNHLNAIPYFSKKKGKYTITFIKGYAGIQYVASKYAMEKPKNIVTELVYSTDIFKPIKKGHDNKVEGYSFEIMNSFDRGKIVGGFGYIEFEDATKNKLIIMTLKDIEKRKPKYAAAEFWGGTTKEWKNGKQVEVETDGWYEEMCLKTLKREVYGMKHIEIDPAKIDEEFQFMKEAESRYIEIEAAQEIEENANSEEFVIDEPIKDNSAKKEKEVIETVENEVVDEGWQKES